MFHCVLPLAIVLMLNCQLLLFYYIACVDGHSFVLFTDISYIYIYIILYYYLLSTNYIIYHYVT